MTKVADESDDRPMVPKLSSAEYLHGYKILVTFEDGKRGILDLEHELWGPVFEPLRDVGLFRQFRFDAELDTIVWPTGADLAPEYLYENAATAPGGRTGTESENTVPLSSRWPTSGGTRWAIG